jgi:glycosyltransferase involved in cell wall biosynthesis
MGGCAVTDLSIVVPVYNEHESVAALHAEILAALDARPDWDCEVIYVDDGSSDGSLAVLAGLAEGDPRTRVVELSRNFGQTAAMYAGFQTSTGRVIVPLDADGQNDPADIFRLVDRLADGYDCVSGWRADRQDKGLSRRLPSSIANKLIVKATGVDIHDSGCTIKAYDGDLLRSIPLYGEMHRLIPFYVHLAGGRVTELPVNHRPRTFGHSKYGITRTFRVIQDITVAKVQADFARRPMHLFGNLGAAVGLVGVLLAVLAVVLKVLGIRDLVDTPLLVLASLFLLAGLQLVIFGLLAEIMLRRLNLGEADRPYRIRAILGGGPDSAT